MLSRQYHHSLCCLCRRCHLVDCHCHSQPSHCSPQLVHLRPTPCLHSSLVQMQMFDPHSPGLSSGMFTSAYALASPIPALFHRPVSSDGSILSTINEFCIWSSTRHIPTFLVVFSTIPVSFPMLCMSISAFDASVWFLMLFNLSPGLLAPPAFRYMPYHHHGLQQTPICRKRCLSNAQPHDSETGISQTWSTLHCMYIGLLSFLTKEEYRYGRLE